jgi:hypothetical protein
MAARSGWAPDRGGGDDGWGRGCGWGSYGGRHPQVICFFCLLRQTLVGSYPTRSICGLIFVHKRGVRAACNTHRIC